MTDEVKRMAAAAAVLEELRHDETGQIVLAAVFSYAYRKGYWDGTKGYGTPTTAFQREVDDAHAEWVAEGAKTHLEMP